MMRCSECEFYECALRTPLGGCGSSAPIVIATMPIIKEEIVPMPRIQLVPPDEITELIRCVREMRECQKNFDKTRITPWKYKAQKYEKKVDELLEKLTEL